MRSVMLWGLLAVVASSGASSHAQVDSAVSQFRAEVNYVEVDAYVSDAAGNPIEDLGISDFEVSEGDKRQDVQVFARVQLSPPRRPELTSDGTPIDSDVRTNGSTEAGRRLYLVVLDDLHIAQAQAARVKAALRQFMAAAVGTQDLAAVVYTSGRSADGQEFTNSLRLLLKAVDNFTGLKLRSATVEKLQDVRLNTRGVASPDADAFATERAHRTRSVLSTLRDLGALMAQFTGSRKTMLFVSEGMDYEISETGASRASTQGAVNTDLQRAVSALNRGNVTVYGLDPRGVATGAEGLAESSSVFEAQNIGVRSARRELQQSNGILQTLSANTGGTSLLWRPQMAQSVDRIVRESSSYYRLGYYASPARASGESYRRLVVRVKRPGVLVRARDGYVAGTPAIRVGSDIVKGLPEHLSRALSSPIPVSRLPMSLSAVAYRRGAKPAVAMALEITLGDPVRSFSNARQTFDVVVVALERGTRVRKAERHTIEVSPNAEAREGQSQGSRARVWMTLDLPAAMYELRVAASITPELTGSLSFDLDVPDFSRENLSASGLVLTSTVSEATVSVEAGSTGRDQWPGDLTATREFASGSPLDVHLDIYGRRADSLSSVSGFVQLRSIEGLVVSRVLPTMESPQVSNNMRRMSATLPLPIAGGSYVVHTEVRAGRETLVRDVPIQVQPRP